MVVALAVIFTWFMHNTQGSLLLIHLLHQSVNAWGEAIPFYPTYTHDMLPFFSVVSLLTLFALLIRRPWSISGGLHGNDALKR